MLVGISRSLANEGCVGTSLCLCRYKLLLVLLKCDMFPRVSRECEEMRDSMINMTKSVDNVAEQFLSQQFHAIDLLFFLRI